MTASTFADTPTPAPAAARTGRRPAMATYARLDLRRQLRDRIGMFFVVGLPTFMFLVFGLGSDDPIGSGNVAMYVMISMAAYGAVTATTSVAGSAATEQVMGWGRQLGLTPMRPVAFVAAKAAVAMAVAAVPVVAIFSIGAATGARGHWTDWVLSGAVVWLGSALFAVYGLAICLVFRGPNAAGIASGMIVVLAFLGNVFTPMSGFMLELGRLTPLYGYVALARFPLTDGHLPVAGTDPLWLPVANVLAWTVIFAMLALWGVRRSRART
ncbi:ABC transporter permease [Nocardioides ganghwensis]|jgi:ABC-2 type transport system permease protein|nr:ABC transporter permease [Nocardioides ganghwensis]